MRLLLRVCRSDMGLGVRSLLCLKHGRNEQKWWKHDEAWERYDYTYKADELEEWLPRIAQISKTAATTFIFANNHWKSQAVDTIRQVRSMLDQLVL